MYISFDKKKTTRYKEAIFKIQTLKNPSLLIENRYKVFSTKDEIKTLNSKEVVKINTNGINSYLDIPIGLLKEIIKNDELFEYTCDVLKKDQRFIMAYVNDLTEKSINSINLGKCDIFLALEKAINDKIILFSFDEIERINTLKNMVSYQAFLEKNEDFSITIDKNEYTVTQKKIIDFLELPIEDLKQLCNKPTIYDIETKHFVYIVNEYVKKYSRNYLLLDYLKKCNELTRYVDIFNINRIKNNDLTYKKIRMNEEFEKEILKDIPDNYNPLEKAIYIYIKLCKTLTYSNEYYLFSESNDIKEKYSIPRLVNKVDTNNNNIVCFQFNLIYQYFLNKIGIEFNTLNSDSFVISKDLYGKVHLKTEFAYEDYIIHADGVRNIYLCDLDGLKINKPIMGLKCINPNDELKDQFNIIVKKVYDYIQMQEIKNGNYVTFNSIMDKYGKYIDDIEDISILNRIQTLIKVVKSYNFPDIDTLSIIEQLSELLFYQKFHVSYIQSNEFVKPTYLIVIAIKDNNRYIYYYTNLNDVNLETINISNDELQRKLNNNIFEGNKKYLPKGMK